MDGLGRKCVDLALVIDCTGTMQTYIDSTQTNIVQICDDIVKTENVNLRVACVGFRDHVTNIARERTQSPKERKLLERSFVTKEHNFTKSPNEIGKFLSNTKAYFGHDEAEAVADGLNAAVNLAWKADATKLCLLITDAPPHGIYSEYDNFPNGCPCGIDPLKDVQKMAEKGITLYVLGCQPSINEYQSFYMGLAHKTGGQFIPLTITDDIARVIEGCLTEELDIERLFTEMEDGVVKADLAIGPTINESELTQRVHKRWKTNGSLSKQLSHNDKELASALQNKEALVISCMTTTAEVRAYKSGLMSIGGASRSGVGPFDKAYRSEYLDENQSLPEDQHARSLEDGSIGSHGSKYRRLIVVTEPVNIEGSGGFSIEVKPVSMAQTSRLIRKCLAKNVVNKLKRL